MSDLTVTLVGRATTDIVLQRTKNGTARLQFRFAANRRRRTDSGDWEDYKSLYITVVCWRELAENVAAAVRKGDPIIVRGDLITRNFTVEEVSRTTFEIDAEMVCHDYSRGQAQGFVRRRRGDIGVVATDSDGLPALAPFDDDEAYPIGQSGDVAYEVVDEHDAPPFSSDGLSETEAATGRLLARSLAASG